MNLHAKIFAVLLAAPALASAQTPPAAAPPAAIAPTPKPCPANAADSRVFAVVLRGNRAGYETSCRVESGREVFYAFNDRGRGPTLHTRARFNARGTPTSVETDGTDYLNNPIRERFSRNGSAASWKNKAEEGTSALSGTAFYVSFSGPVEEIGWLATALLQDPGHRLALLPSGEARLESFGDRRITAGGKTRSVRLHAISGLGFQPGYVWLDDSGEFFASVSAWLTVIPEGWEGAAPDLLRVQDDRDALRFREAARRAGRTPAAALVFRGARLFDSKQAAATPGMTVVVSGNRIVAVGADGSVEIPRGAEVVDAAGKTLLPGLFDMHAHPSADDGMLHLLAGVTSIRDMAAEPGKTAELSAWETGDAAGPRVVFAGIIDGPGPFQGPTKTLVANEAEARDAVRRSSFP
jgi:hypothetical protein